MDPDEEDWGGKVEFGFSDKHFEKNSEDSFVRRKVNNLAQ